MSLAELTELKQSEGKWFGEFYRHPKGLPMTENGVKVGLIRHHFTHWLVYWQQQRMLNTLYCIDLKPFLDLSYKDIIEAITNTLREKHPSKKVVTDKVLKEVINELGGK